MRYELRVCDTCGAISREVMIGEPIGGWEVHDGEDYCATCVWDILECGDHPERYAGVRAGQKERT
jgi:hypothetical protein